MQPRVVLASQAACPKERCPTASNGEFCCLRITRLQHTADHSFTVAVILTVTSCRLHHTHCHCMHLSRSSRLALAMLNMSMLYHVHAYHVTALHCKDRTCLPCPCLPCPCLPCYCPLLSPTAAYMALPWSCTFIALATKKIPDSTLCQQREKAHAVPPTKRSLLNENFRNIRPILP